MLALQTSARTQKPPVARIIAYLIVSVVLSIVSIVLVTLGLTLGVGTLILWIGLPVLIGTFALVRGIGAIERSLARQLLGAVIAEPHPRRHTRGIWRTALAMLGDPQVWKSLLYIVLKAPISIVLLVIMGVLLGAPLGLMLTPLGYLIPTFILAILGIQVQNTSPAWLTPIEIVITGQFDPLMLAKTLLFAAIGIALWFPVRVALRWLGEFSGALASGLLSPNVTE